MEPSNLKKSKKRKQRKSCEELKKRRNIDDANKPREKSCCLRSCNCITSNRLTLYNKVVRSETATRLQLSKSEGNNRMEINENNGMIRGKFRINVLPLKKDIEKSENDISDEISKSVRKYKVQKVKTYGESSDSDISFHVGELDEDGINDALEKPYRVSLLNSFPIDDDDDDDPEKDLYREFIDDIEQYIGEIAPELLNLDFLEKMRAPFLTFAWPNNDGANVAKNYTPKYSNELIKEHTMRYTANSFEDSDYQTKATVPDISMCTSVNKSSPNSSDTHSSPSISSIVCDSPEHTYYPHKLN